MIDPKIQEAMDEIRARREERRRANGNGGSYSDAPPLPFLSMSKWDSEPVPERAWAVRDKIPLRQTTLHSGQGAVGKSTIELHRSCAHVLARDWIGMMPEPGPALFIDAEDDADEIHIRLKAVIDHYGVTFSDLIAGGLHLISLTGRDAVLAAPNKNDNIIEPTTLYKQIFEFVGDIKPKSIAIASSANVFAGNENDRAHVQQTVGLFTRLAVVSNGAVVLITHPSLTGINTDTGLSGTTQWHNAVRARYYSKGVKPSDGEQPDSDLRQIEFKKNQYGPIGETVVLRYQRGMFLPVPGVSTLEKFAKDAVADDVFLGLLRRFTAANRSVSDKTSISYAPAVFAREKEAQQAGADGKALADAMRRLFEAGKIWNEPCGRPSRRSYRLAIKT
jgi:RecA-family ATPase